MSLDPAAVEAMITPRTQAILAVHCYGLPCDTEGLADVARRHGLRLLGPGSIGLSVPGAHLDASLLARPPKAGDLALVSQSGTVAAGIVEWAARRDVGFSAVLSLGIACDIDVADCLDHFAADIRTRAILLSLDAVVDARKFMSAARAAPWRASTPC